MTRRTRRAIGGFGPLAVVAALAIGAGTVGAAPAGKADSGTVYAAITHVVGGTAFVAGDATDKLLGAGATTFRLKVTKSTKAATYKATGPVTGFEKNGSFSGIATTTEVVPRMARSRAPARSTSRMGRAASPATASPGRSPGAQSRWRGRSCSATRASTAEPPGREPAGSRPPPAPQPPARIAGDGCAR